MDFWNGKCYVSLVGLRFINTKAKGFYIPFHRDFEEINLRFYVRYKNNSEWKRGVTFIKEIVPKPALIFVANAFYGEKYVTFPTRHQCHNRANSMKISYEWKHQGAWDSIEVNAALTPSSILPNSEEEFITEHYWGYTQISNRLTSEYQVEHPQWTVYSVLNHKIKVRFSELYGKEFAQLQDTIPGSVMLTEGSGIAVLGASKIQ